MSNHSIPVRSAGEGDIFVIHGLWMRSPIMWALGWRIARSGFKVHFYNYRSTRFTIEEHAATLAKYLTARKLARINIVGHSLGGVMAVAAAQLLSSVPGRIVALGSPLMGSRAGSALAVHPWLSRLSGELGKTWEQGVSRLSIPENWQCGMIAGTSSIGIGQVLTDYDSANDGAVSVAETRHPGLAAHICLPTTHSGMLFNKQVAANAISFIKSGKFL